MAFTYQFRGEHPSRPSVIRVWFGKAYFIWKVMALHTGIENMSTDIDRRRRLGVKNPDTDIYTKVISRIKHARVTMMEVEVMLQSDDPAELLVLEHQLLAAGKSDELCLNNLTVPYLPKWIPQVKVDEYLQTIAALAKPKKRKARNTAKKDLSRPQAGKGSTRKTKASQSAPVKAGKVSASKKAAAKSAPKKKGAKA